VLNKDYKEPILLTVYDKASYWGWKSDASVSAHS
jgi:hypothetical protein